MQLAGAEAGKPACMALLSAFEAGRQPRLAMQVRSHDMWLYLGNLCCTIAPGLYAYMIVIHFIWRHARHLRRRLNSQAALSWLLPKSNFSHPRSYMCAAASIETMTVVQLLDALAEESSPTQLDGDIMVAALRVCAKTGAWQSALRVWERLQNPAQQPPQQQQQQSAQLKSAAGQLVIQACKAGKNPSKAAELAAEFRRPAQRPDGGSAASS